MTWRIQNLPVRLCMDRGGLSGDDGPTHHGLFDIGYLRHVPNLVHMQPKDEDEFVDMLWTMANYDKGPIAIRYPRGVRHRREAQGQAGAPRDRQGRGGRSRTGDVALIGLGDMFAHGRADPRTAGAARASRPPSSTRAGSSRSTAPCSSASPQQCKVICTFEDHVLHNGFGCAVIEHLHDAGIHTPVVRIGWPDDFVEHGSVPVLRKKHGLTAENAVEKIVAALASS